MNPVSVWLNMRDEEFMGFMAHMSWLSQVWPLLLGLRDKHSVCVYFAPFYPVLDQDLHSSCLIEYALLG